MSPLALFLCLALPAGVSYAQGDAPAVSDSMQASAGDDDGTINKQDMERIFKAEEIILKKLKEQHVRQERHQHRLATQQLYQQALNLYQQQRMSQAQTALNKVENSMPDYKSTVALLKIVDKRTLLELQDEMRRIRAVNSLKAETQLEHKAYVLYQQAVYLIGAKDTPFARKKLGKLKADFQQLSEEIYIRRQLGKIAQEAEGFDREIFRLTQAKDYPAAKRKFDDFQQAMIDDLTNLKRAVALKESLFNMAQDY